MKSWSMAERIRNRHAFTELPFEGLTSYEIELNSQSTKKYTINLLDNHKLCEYLKESYLNTVFNPNDLHLCNYFDEDEFIACNRNTTSHLNILSMNIRSLPKYSGELKCFIKVLGNESDIIVLAEIGSRNISTVEHLFGGYVFFYVIPDVNCYGGVDIYVSEKMENVYIDEHLSIINHVIVSNVKQKVFLWDLFIIMYHLFLVEFIGIPTEILLIL